MKKKIISLCLVVVLALTAIGGATLAYFTDTDKADNVFTVGKVTIKLNEKERDYDEDGNLKNDLKDFEKGKLYPIVGSAQGEKDKFGMPVAANYVDKMITVTNTGTEDAWVRVYFAIPAALDNGYEDYNAGLNILHFNTGSYQKADGSWDNVVDGGQWIRKFTSGNVTKWNYFETTMDNIKYNVYYGDYYRPLANGEATERFVDGVYLDETFDTEVVKDEDNEDVTQYFVMQKNKETDEKEKKVLTLDAAWDWDDVKCPVFAVAVQAAGFDNAKDAIKASFGEYYNPWGTTVENWQE